MENDEHREGRTASLAIEPVRDAKRRGYILVAEDNRLVREGLAEILREEGYAVVSCSDGQAAMNRIRSSAELPALIVLDFMMPRMDGWAFLAEREKNARLRAIPVLGISAAQMFAQQNRRPDGVDEMLQKPFTVEAILDWVRRRWAARRIEQETVYRLDW
jgi:CheY-like chemotaxis protein